MPLASQSEASRASLHRMECQGVIPPWNFIKLCEVLSCSQPQGFQVAEFYDLFFFAFPLTISIILPYNPALLTLVVKQLYIHGSEVCDKDLRVAMHKSCFICFMFCYQARTADLSKWLLLLCMRRNLANTWCLISFNSRMTADHYQKVEQITVNYLWIHLPETSKTVSTFNVAICLLTKCFCYDKVVNSAFKDKLGFFRTSKARYVALGTWFQYLQLQEHLWKPLYIEYSPFQCLAHKNSSSAHWMHHTLY